MAKKVSHAPAEGQPAGKAPEPAAAPTNGNGSAQPKGPAPVWKKRLYNSGAYVECAVFRTEIDRGQSSFTAFDVVLDRSYRDGDGKWHTSPSLRRDDLLVAAHALQRAYAGLSEQDRP